MPLLEGEVRVHDNLIDGSANYRIFVWTSGSSVTGATIGGNTIKNNPGGAIFYEGGDLPPDIDELETTRAAERH